MKIIRATVGHANILANYFAVNEEHLQKWSPAVPTGHHSIEAWRLRLEQREQDFEQGQAFHFIGTDQAESHVIAGCSLSNIVRGVFQAGHMGYSVAKRYEGQGYMKRLVTYTIEYGFNELKLHRIMANHMPDNERSAGLLKSLGFEREGYARDYLLINGRWEDHVLNALINPGY
jgi:[ribosomal protein S5]-alanine N-acetyltransferase